jgi:hypothetical protein
VLNGDSRFLQNVGTYPLYQTIQHWIPDDWNINIPDLFIGFLVYSVAFSNCSGYVTFLGKNCVKLGRLKQEAVDSSGTWRSVRVV